MLTAPSATWTILSIQTRKKRWVFTMAFLVSLAEFLDLVQFWCAVPSHGLFNRQEYLNGTPRLRSNKEGEKKEEEKVNKYTEIMRKLVPLFEEYSDYRLYVTGHSLGASLAILFAVEAAGSSIYNVPKPVTCIK